MLFKSDTEWNVLKMLCMELKVRLQRHTKVTSGRRGFLKRIIINLPPINDNEINTFHSDVQK